MVSVYVDGYEELNEISVQLHRAAGRVGAEAAAGVKAVAFFVESNSKQIAPVDTGHLRGAIGPPTFQGDGRSGEMEAEITSHANYSLYVEVGTSRQAPQAFMGPSADRAGPMLEAIALRFSDPLAGP